MAHDRHLAMLLPSTIGGVNDLKPFKGQKVFAVFALIDGVGVRTSVP